jgi:hypothetical protein
MKRTLVLGDMFLCWDRFDEERDSYECADAEFLTKLCFGPW